MKLGIIGATSNVKAILEEIQDNFTNIEPVPAYTDFLADTVPIIEKLENETQAILFTGPNNYRYAQSYLPKHKLPWGYLPHNRVSALQALMQAAMQYQSKLPSISLDSYEEEPIRQALASVGITNTKITKLSFDLTNPQAPEEVYKFHCQCYAENPQNIALTSFGYSDTLTQSDVPCIRIVAAKEIIREQIYALQLQNLMQQDKQGTLAVVAVHYNYLFDDEKDMALREWEKLRYQNAIKEHIYTIAEKVQGAVFQDDMVPFFIVTSRELLDKVFLKQQEYVQLLQFGQQMQRFRLCLGIGLGSSMLEAKSRATMALNKAFGETGARAYIAESEHELAVPVFTESENQAEKLNRLSKQYGISVMTLQRLKKAVANTGNITTVENLAPMLGISIRSVNRILSKLEDSGYITIVSKAYNGKGRPARVLRIVLP